MSSHMAALGRIRLDDLNSERRYGRFSAYQQSKLANLMFALELSRRAGDRLLSAGELWDESERLTGVSY